MRYVIFSIDNPYDLLNVSRFLRHFETKRVMDETKGTLKFCIGKWKAQMETSYICAYSDFLSVVLPSGFIDNQEAVVEVTQDVKRRSWARLIYLGTDKVSDFKPLVSVSAEEAGKCDGYTYRPDLDTYFVIKE